MNPYRQHFHPERAHAGAFMAGVALALWLGLLPLVVYLTNN